MKKILFIFAICYICLQLSYTLFDISTRSIDPVAHPDFNSSEKLYHKGVYLVSFADGNEVFYQNQNALAQSALNRGIDFIFNYRKSHIDEDFYTKYQAILGEKYGAGYWLWKPYIILKTMENTPEGSIIVYADSGAILTGSLVPILKHLENHDGILYRYNRDIYGTIKGSIDRQVAQELAISAHLEFDKSKPLWAGFMVFRNSKQTKEFVKHWLNLCCNPDFIKGYGKSRHMHDQALLNAAYLKYPEGIIALAEDDFQPMLKWQHRHPSEVNFSLMPYQQQAMSYTEHKAWRFPPLKWLRYVLLRG